MNCRVCGSKTEADTPTCQACGALVSTACSRCGVETQPNDRFCASCGQRLGADRPVEGERRQVTIVFCDLVGSAALSGSLDPEDWAEILHRYHDVCRQTVERLDGHVAQYLGDGVLIYFGYPRAYEDASRRAVQAALRLAEAVSALAVQVRGRGIELRARVGLHAGMVVLDPVGVRGEALALGDAPSLAARVQAEAMPGTVVITETVHRMVAGFFRETPLGAHVLRGFPRAISLYRV
jgi:class 3 adenylate cyclase